MNQSGLNNSSQEQSLQNSRTYEKDSGLEKVKKAERTTRANFILDKVKPAFINGILEDGEVNFYNLKELSEIFEVNYNTLVQAKSRDTDDWVLLRKKAQDEYTKDLNAIEQATRLKNIKEYNEVYYELGQKAVKRIQEMLESDEKLKTKDFVNIANALSKTQIIQAKSLGIDKDDDNDDSREIVINIEGV